MTVEIPVFGPRSKSATLPKAKRQRLVQSEDEESKTSSDLHSSDVTDRDAPKDDKANDEDDGEDELSSNDESEPPTKFVRSESEVCDSAS
jgi:hypothetical protein